MVDTKKLDFKLNIMFASILIIVGGMFNLFAIVVNDGKMPVLIDYYFEGEMHRGFTSCDEITYCYIADVLNIGNIYFSLGDIFITIGVMFVLFFYAKRIAEYYKFRKQFKKMKEHYDWDEK